MAASIYQVAQIDGTAARAERVERAERAEGKRVDWGGAPRPDFFCVWGKWLRCLFVGLINHRKWVRWGGSLKTEVLFRLDPPEWIRFGSLVNSPKWGGNLKTDTPCSLHQMFRWQVLSAVLFTELDEFDKLAAKAGGSRSNWPRMRMSPR